MRTILILSFVIALTGCAAGQRYSECDKQYPKPSNVGWLDAANNSGAAGPVLFSYMMASVSGEDTGAYDQWRQNIATCIDQKAASTQ